jgi:uncharacterized membrane protein YesL
MGIFSPEGKLARFLNRLGDLIILNILTIICCIPVVTAGAALTALYSCTLKMAKNEEGKVVSDYFRAFRQNFRQATILWLIFGGAMALILLDIYMLQYVSGSYVMAYKGVLLVLLVIIAMVLMYVFPVLARFENTTVNTAKNAFLFCMIHIIKSVFLFLLILLPWAALFLSMRIVSVDFLVGISGPAFLASLYYRKVFAGFEQTAEEGSK